MGDLPPESYRLCPCWPPSSAAVGASYLVGHIGEKVMTKQTYTHNRTDKFIHRGNYREVAKQHTIKSPFALSGGDFVTPEPAETTFLISVRRQIL